MSVLHLKVGDLHAHFERERETEKATAQAAEQAAKREREAAKQGTLGELLKVYLNQLTGHTQSDVRSVFALHVPQDLAARRAADLGVDDFVAAIAKVVAANKGATANKLRSHLRAAYQAAIDSKTDAGVPMILRTYGITVNPLASIKRMAQFDRADTRHLDAIEFAHFLRRLDAMPQDAKCDAVELGLLARGQRVIQLLRLRPCDVDLPAGTITLYDAKGGWAQPYAHRIPLTDAAIEILKRRLDLMPEGSPYVFTTDGTKHLDTFTTQKLVTKIAAAMIEAREARAAFSQKHIRKTAETMLAALKVSSDVRAMLQSHGLGGVQKRHCDFHDYADEMREALEKWARHLDALRSGEVAKVVKLRRSA